MFFDDLSTAKLLLALTGVIFYSFIHIIVDERIRAAKLKRPGSNAPILNLKNCNYAAAARDYSENLQSLIRDGYERFTDGAYQLWTVDGFRTILSPKYMEELKSLSPRVLDFHAAAQKNMVGEYEWVKVGSELIANTILHNLTQRIGDITDELQEEIEFSCGKEIPACDSPTAIPVFDTIQQIVTSVSGRAFVGPELNRNKEWLDVTRQFAQDVFQGGWKLEQWSRALRPFVLYFIPEIQRVWKHQAAAQRILVPIMEGRRLAELQKPGYEKPNDMISWLMDTAAKQPAPIPFKEIAKQHLLTSMAAIHTTTNALTHAIYDLASHGEYVDALRDEIRQCRQENGDIHNKQSSWKMKKMDSFIKESQRLNPAGVFTFARLVQKPITLSDGTTLSKGCQIMVPFHMVSMDPRVWDSPEKFSGFRFSDMRDAKKEDSHKYQFATATNQTLNWGAGKNTCPGRFFAAYEIKSILGHLIENFDIRLADETAGRPKNFEMGMEVSPDRDAKILFQARVE